MIVALLMSPVLAAALDPNPALHSSIASATLTARARAGISISQTFDGTAYYEKPHERIVFDNVPGPLRRFRSLDTTLPSAAEASATYSIRAVADDGRLATFELDPKDLTARVKTLVIAVDDRTGLVTTVVWSYRDGGSLTVNESYQTNGSFRVPSTIAIAARFPAYAVDGVIHLSHYRFNVDVAPAMSASPSPHNVKLILAFML